MPRNVSSNIQDFHDKNKKLLEQLGWVVKFEEDILSLHRRFKNGKVMKGSDVSMQYEEYSYDTIINDDGSIQLSEGRLGVFSFQKGDQEKNLGICMRAALTVEHMGV